MSTLTQPPGDTADPAVALAVFADALRVLAAAAPTRAQVSELGEHLVTLQSLLDAGAGVAARWTKSFDDAGGPEDDGAPSLVAWLRRELRLTPSEARRRVRAAAALDFFPATRDDLYLGQIHTSHLDAIAHGVHQLGAEVFAAFEDVVLGVARECDADAVRQTIAKIRDTLDPDAGEAAFVRALEKRDVTVTPVGDGFALSGFLPADTGALFREVLYAAGRPASADDDRTAGQCRVDGLHELCAGVLAHGLPTDRGLRPHLFVTVSAERLAAASASQPTVGTEPAELAGHGPIPDSLLARLACDCSLTPVVTAPDGHVLDVGRTQRLATLKQRQAIQVQQGGTCFNPGCDRTHLEIHHLIPWSMGGKTNLADLRGYCTRCHHLIHQGLLVTTPDGNGGWTHRTRREKRLVDQRRRWSRRASQFTRDVLVGGVEHASSRLRGPLIPEQPGPAP